MKKIINTFYKLFKNKNTFLIFLFFLMCGLLFYTPIFRGYMFGSTLDWSNQHVPFPQYFRDLFYQTGDLTPQFSFHLGAGQNMFNFVYHGFLNPVIFPSYFLPFIKMSTYISLLGFLIFVFSGWLMYYWLVDNGFSKLTSIAVGLLIMFSGPISFHAHRHYMFISYIPFLIVSLKGIDYYFKKNSNLLFIAGLTLSFLVSFYYAPAVSFVVFIYWIYKYLSIEKEITIKNLLLSTKKFFLYYLIAVLISSITLVPVAMSLLLGRSSEINQVSLNELFFPLVEYRFVLYDTYTAGLTAIVILSVLVNLIIGNKSKRFLSLALLIIVTIPIFSYLFNGFLYFRGKAFIPFIPLFGLIVAITIEEFVSFKKRNKQLFLIGIILVIVFHYMKNIYDSDIFMIDLIITFLVFTGLYINKKTRIILLLIPLFMIWSSFNENKEERFMTKDFFTSRTGSEELIGKIGNTIDSDDEFYRFINLVENTYYTPNYVYDHNYFTTSIYSSTYNYNYYNFLRNEINASHPSPSMSPIHSDNNTILHTFMGVKYIASHKEKEGIGYEKILEGETFEIYKNNNVFPIGFANTKTLSYDYFSSLSVPERNEAILNYIIVDEVAKMPQHNTNIESYDLMLSNISVDDEITMTEENGVYKISTNESAEVVLNLEKPLENKLLFVELDVLNSTSCSSYRKMMIGINKVENTLSCRTAIYHNSNENFHFIVSSSDGVVDQLVFRFFPGSYEISNINFNILDYEYVKEANQKISRLEVFNDDVGTNKLKGEIEVLEAGWFSFTIPYDKGFTIMVNGEKTDYEMVNGGFIGFPIEEGKHLIELKYSSPGFKAGKFLSSMGLIILIYVNKNNKIRKGDLV